MFFTFPEIVKTSYESGYFDPAKPANPELFDKYHFVYHNDLVRGGFLAILLKKDRFESAFTHSPDMNDYHYGYAATQMPTRIQYIVSKDKFGTTYNFVNFHLPNNPTDVEGTQAVRDGSSKIFGAIAAGKHPTIIAGDSNIGIRGEIKWEIENADHLTSHDNIEGYTSYSDVVCVRGNLGRVTSSYIIKDNKYEFIDRIYTKGLKRQNASEKVKPYSTYVTDVTGPVSRFVLMNTEPFDRLSPGGFHIAFLQPLITKV